jgi:hypothetical protein
MSPLALTTPSRTMISGRPPCEALRAKDSASSQFSSRVALKSE